MFIEKYFSLFCVAIVGINLLYGRYRATALVASGRVTSYELNNFVWSTFVLLGGAFLAFWIIEEIDRSNILCLLVFPPRRNAGLAVWSIQAIVSGTTVYWLWARNGADILARLAPAFTRGAVLEREFSVARVRWLVSAVAVGAPLLAIIAQVTHPEISPACERV